MYDSNGLWPGLFFFKYLAQTYSTSKSPNENKKGRIAINIPDTIVFNDEKDGNYWIYSSEDGLLYRHDYFDSSTIMNQFKGDYPNELVALIKRVENFMI